VHVSDLHFGDALYTLWGAILNLIPGLETHSELAVKALSDSVRTQRLNDPTPIRVVATGDLTTWGRSSAFLLAFTYLRGQIPPGTGRIGLGLNDPEAVVVPGNHDIWSSMPLGVIPVVATLPPSIRANFAQFFNPPAPAPSASYPSSGAPFPYRVRLYNGPPAIYLYGLDSTRVDAAPAPLWRNFRADGFVDEPQLKDLVELVNGEPDKPCIRIAAIHHPLAYPRTTRTPGFGTLINLDSDASDVLPTLQRLGFAIALCGHQHRGFVRQNGASNMVDPPIWVFSVGTSTQIVRLSHQEEQLLNRPYTSLNPNEQRQWRAIAEKCNEYRTYDFEVDPQAPNQLKVGVHVYRFDPNMLTFVKNSLTQPIPIQIR
jgi:3',5'-cyclic AMP phosphodiesterase CpdA